MPAAQLSVQIGVMATSLRENKEVVEEDVRKEEVDIDDETTGRRGE